MSAELGELGARLRSSGNSARDLIPLLKEWLCSTPARLSEQRALCFVEVGFRSTADTDNPYLVDAPVGLDPSNPWFWLGFARQVPMREAVVLWFAPAPALDDLRRRADWQSDNALGLDFVAAAGAETQRVFDAPGLRDVIDAFAGLTTASIELHGPGFEDGP
jgi:hypothetical protein